MTMEIFYDPEDDVTQVTLKPGRWEIKLWKDSPGEEIDNPPTSAVTHIVTSSDITTVHDVPTPTGSGNRVRAIAREAPSGDPPLFGVWGPTPPRASGPSPGPTPDEPRPH